MGKKKAKEASGGEGDGKAPKVTLVNGQGRQELELPEGATVKDLLAKADVKLEKGKVVEREGEVLTEDAVLNDGDVVVVTEDDENGQA